MFDIGHSIDYSSYKNMVRILYSNLDLSHLPLFRRNLDEFLAEIREAGFYLFLEFIIPRRASHGVQIREIDFVENLEAKKIIPL